MKWRLPLLATLVSLAAATPAAGAELQLTEVRTAVFPDRAYVLTLPDSRLIDASDVKVIENGGGVSDVEVVAGGSSAVVLVIDTSDSMRGGAMEDAMVAAREFAERRRPDQPLGIVFFSRENRVVLEPTTDSGAIDRALAATPPLSHGTRLFDATQVAIEMVERASVDTGAAVVLSDGADTGSLTSRESVVDSAAAARTRLYTIGLRSDRFDSAELRALAATNGQYAEARSAADLATVFGALSDRLANEYLLRYRSLAPLSTDVAVEVSVAGINGVATAGYRTSSLGPDGARSAAVTDSPWRSAAAAIAVAVVVATLLALALLVLVRPRQRTVEERISAFVPDKPRSSRLPSLPAVAALPVLASADRWLERFTPWSDFKLDIDVAQIKLSAIRLLLITAAVMLGLFALLWMVAGDEVMAIVALIVLPVGVRVFVALRANSVRRRFEQQLPDNLQVLSSALRAGHSFVGALNIMVVDAPEPSRREYRRVVSNEQLGIPIEDSLAVVSDRMRCEDVVYIGLIATLQRETGGNTAEVLDKIVETLRERAKLRRLVRTLTVQGRLGGWIVTALPIAMLAFLNFTQPGYMDPMLEETLGIVILIAAGVCIAVGAYAIRRIVDIRV